MRHASAVSLSGGGSSGSNSCQLVDARFYTGIATIAFYQSAFFVVRARFERCVGLDLIGTAHP